VGELFPLLAGVLTGAVALGLPTRKLRTTCVGAMSVVFGVIATLLNGEELFMVPVDILIVGVPALAILAGHRLWVRARHRAPIARRDARSAEEDGAASSMS
jgi:uncharacterized membrane protein